MDTLRPTILKAEQLINAYFPVLDNGFVALKDYMGGDSSIEEAARVSYGQGTRKVSDTRTLLRYLFRQKHFSPFEQTELKLHIGLPIFVMRQLIRHRMAQINEYSGRYSIMPMIFYTPERSAVQKQSKANKQGRENTLTDFDYDVFTYNMGQTRFYAKKQYHQSLEIDIAKEMARIDLPLSTYTFCYWKIDLRNMFNILSLRCDSHAQEEIRVFADVMAGIVQALCPISFEAFQDYQQTAVTFSQIEMQGIRRLAMHHTSPIIWESPPEDIRDDVNELFSELGVSYSKDGKEGREMTEFWNKLKTQVKKDYSLDLTTAKTPEYFRKMVEKHAIEMPQTT